MHHSRHEEKLHCVFRVKVLQKAHNSRTFLSYPLVLDTFRVLIQFLFDRRVHFKVWDGKVELGLFLRMWIWYHDWATDATNQPSKYKAHICIVPHKQLSQGLYHFILVGFLWWSMYHIYLRCMRSGEFFLLWYR